MLVPIEVENKLFEGGGRKDGTELNVAVFVELRELGEIGLAPRGFRFGTIGRSAALDATSGVDGKDVVWVTGGGESVGVSAWEKSPKG